MKSLTAWSFLRTLTDSVIPWHYLLNTLHVDLEVFERWHFNIMKECSLTTGLPTNEGSSLDKKEILYNLEVCVVVKVFHLEDEQWGVSVSPQEPEISLKPKHTEPEVILQWLEATWSLDQKWCGIPAHFAH